MRVQFYFADKFLPGTQVEASEIREVAEVPRKGELVVWHSPEKSRNYTVVQVYWIYEDRPRYAGKDYPDVAVRLEEVPR